MTADEAKKPEQQEKAPDKPFLAAEPAPELEQKLADLQNKYLRAVADLANAHKRFQKEREHLGRLAVVTFVRKLLPVMDSLSRSLKTADENQDARALIAGFKLIEDQMLHVLTQSGIKPIESVGKQFDPEVHHAVVTEITAAHPPGMVTEEMGRGFTLDGMVIRAAEVKVAAPPPQSAPGAEKATGTGKKG